MFSAIDQIQTFGLLQLEGDNRNILAYLIVVEIPSQEYILVELLQIHCVYYCRNYVRLGLLIIYWSALATSPIHLCPRLSVG